MRTRKRGFAFSDSSIRYTVCFRQGCVRSPESSFLSDQEMSVAVKKGAILAPLAPSGPAAFWNEPFSPPRRRNSERPGAVKGAPLLDAAKRTLDGEDRSARLEGERKAWRRTSERWGKKMAPSLGATDTRIRRTEVRLIWSWRAISDLLIPCRCSLRAWAVW